ncbi:MAG TPA: ATP-dependent DNA ligase [Actinomycetota bacterium]|nr:ATP-dependent DNA ligase [Actinomycetota bacterium]
MTLPFKPTVAPMEAKVAADVPTGSDWRYEPKWDGFRSIVWRDGPNVTITSRKQLPFNRYFPELEAAFAAVKIPDGVYDGEIVIFGKRGLDFNALLQRIHPAASRVRMLSETTPSSFVAFDLLAEGTEDLRGVGFAERRARLERAMKRAKTPLLLSPQTADPDEARGWLTEYDVAGLDGVVAKRGDRPYKSGEREMIKVKRQRTADCVVGGFRWYKNAHGKAIGSLLLGLFHEGKLHNVGFTSGFSAKDRVEVAKVLKPHMGGAGFSGAGPGGPSRWRSEEEAEYQPLDPVLVVEVWFDQVTGHRIRHGARFIRWRPDKPPESCTFEQLYPTGTTEELNELFEGWA